MIEVLNSERFFDVTPYIVFAILLDEGVFLCSIRTMYRILQEMGLVRERRLGHQQKHHPVPQLCATAPNQVWTWDITKLRGEAKGVMYYLYVVLDMFSRLIVGWHLSKSESAEQASDLFSACVDAQGVSREQLTVHSDRGAAMTSGFLSDLMRELGIGQSFSRPRVSNDNPYVESHFKTLKYRPEYPRRFESFDAAERYVEDFVDWYNHQHRHHGIAYLTPAEVHSGKAEVVIQQRQEVMSRVYLSNPKRFRNRRPMVKSVPTEVWINRPGENLVVLEEGAIENVA